MTNLLRLRQRVKSLLLTATLWGDHVSSVIIQLYGCFVSFSVTSVKLAQVAI